MLCVSIVVLHKCSYLAGNIQPNVCVHLGDSTHWGLVVIQAAGVRGRLPGCLVAELLVVGLGQLDSGGAERNGCHPWTEACVLPGSRIFWFVTEAGSLGPAS